MLDYYAIADLLTVEERQYQTIVRQFLEKEALPYINKWWEKGDFPIHLVSRFGELGLLGATIPGIGSDTISNVGHGLIMYELERVDSGLRSFVSVQSSLVMYPIHRYGSKRQKQMYLKALSSGDMIGCFGLTERDGGSDVSSMATSAIKDGDDYILNGTKMWISNGCIANLAVVWAKDENGEVVGFLVPTDTPGFKSHRIDRKMSLRASVTSELVLNNVRVGIGQMLPNAKGLSAPLSCLTQARFGIAWGALGALESVYSESLDFSKIRKTFGKSLATRQLIQQKLTQMVSDHTSGLLLAWRIGRMKDADTLEHTQVSLAKRHNVRAALLAARAAREILGANGITLDYHTIRHLLNLETVDTYEGTYDIHTLVIGRHITGSDAFH